MCIELAFRVKAVLAAFLAYCTDAVCIYPAGGNFNVCPDVSKCSVIYVVWDQKPALYIKHQLWKDGD